MAKIEDASLRTVEANLVVIVNKRGGDRAIGEIIAG